jgi:hypothetical protein
MHVMPCAVQLDNVAVGRLYCDYFCWPFPLAKNTTSSGIWLQKQDFISDSKLLIATTPIITLGVGLLSPLRMRLCVLLRDVQILVQLFEIFQWAFTQAGWEFPFPTPRFL